MISLVELDTYDLSEIRTAIQLIKPFRFHHRILQCPGIDKAKTLHLAELLRQNSKDFSAAMLFYMAKRDGIMKKSRRRNANHKK